MFLKVASTKNIPGPLYFNANVNCTNDNSNAFFNAISIEPVDENPLNPAFHISDLKPDHWIVDLDQILDIAANEIYQELNFLTPALSSFQPVTSAIQNLLKNNDFVQKKRPS